MGQAMEIDILEVHKSKTLLLAHFLLKCFNTFVNGAKLPKDLPFFNC